MQEPQSIEKLLDTPQKKLAFFQNLILIAAADGRLQKGERNFIVDIGNRLGLTQEEVAPIGENLEVLSFIIPEDGMQKTIELQTLVMMMVEDGRIHDSEYALCLEYAHRIGYGKEILDDLIKQLSGNSNSGKGA